MTAPTERVLVVTAVDAERDAIVAAGAQSDDVVVVGVGPVAAAAGAAVCLAEAAHAGAPFDLVVSAGIGGGFDPMSVGEIAVATASVFADLGAQSENGFKPVSALGLGVDRYDVAPKLAVELADRTGGHLGTVLTVATVTGTSARVTELAARFSDAVAEGMEGAGVAAAAARHGVAFAEVRAISNRVGPRDRASWRVPDALTALGRAVAAVIA